MNFLIKVSLILLVLLQMLALSICFANEEARPKSYISASLKAENSNFVWSISDQGEEQSPNIISELEWKDIQSYGFEILGEHYLINTQYDFYPFIRGQVFYGQIVEGQNRDSDYHGDNRTEEYSRTENGADDGHILRISTALGIKTPLTEKISISPLAGYMYFEQRLVMRDGYQKIPETGAFDGLNSSYESLWNGPWLGLELGYSLTKKLRLTGGIQYHWFDYEAWANWNLIELYRHPKSFQHDAKGNGTIFDVRAEYLLRKSLRTFISINLNLLQNCIQYFEYN